MRVVRSPKLSDYFSYNNKWTSFSDFYYYNQSIFNKFSMAVVFILINLMLGIIIRPCLTIAISTMVFLFYSYLKAKKESENIVVIRKLPIYAHELDNISVEYTLSNASSFIIDNFYVTDSFDGTRENIINIDFGKSIPERSLNLKKKHYSLNAGMGIKLFGPLIVYVSDPLNIFQFQITEDKRESIKVYPQIEKIRDMVLRGDKYALQFGLYDTSARGDTTNFIGIRPYRDGDPTRRINWKLSMKAKKKVLNEFEKNVNTTLSIILNMDESLHMGKGTLSTWEYAKDICLAMATKQVTVGNNVQFFSNDVYIPSSTGQTHMNFLELVICMLALSRSAENNTLVKRALLQISHESKLLYITPAYPCQAFEENLHAIKDFSKFNPNIHVAFIDGSREIAEAVKGNMGVSFIGIHQQTQRLLDKKIIELHNLGIECSLVKITSDQSHEKQIMTSLEPTHGGSLD